jgi:hypothetical protein
MITTREEQGGTIAADELLDMIRAAGIDPAAVDMPEPIFRSENGDRFGVRQVQSLMSQLTRTRFGIRTERFSYR